MNNLVSLLTTFTGRFGRQQWWIGFVIVLIGSIAGTILLNPEVVTAEDIPPPKWADTIWQLFLLVPGTAITIKRFNDRDWPWWLGYALGAFGALIYLLPHAGVLIDPAADWTGAILYWVFFLTLIAAFVDNGFLRGTRGPNRYGPDPIPQGTTTA